MAYSGSNGWNSDRWSGVKRTYSSEDVARFLMRDAGVVVLHGAAYGPGGEGTLRVSFAAGGETLERGLDRLREGLLRLADEAKRTPSSDH